MRYCILAVLLCALLAACNRAESFSPEEDTGVQIANQVSIFESKDNQKQWILTAEAVDFTDLNTPTLKNPVLLLKQDGKDTARVSGDSGSFDYLKKLVTIRGHAQINSLTQKVFITTDHFFYDVNQDRIWSDTKTIITRATAKSVARGGVITDSKLSKIELKNHSTRVPSTTGELKP